METLKMYPPKIFWIITKRLNWCAQVNKIPVSILIYICCTETHLDERSNFYLMWNEYQELSQGQDTGHWTFVSGTTYSVQDSI